MTLPRGWRETAPRSNREGSWRFQVRNPGRFRYDTLRTIALEGVKGVKLVAGKLQKGDQELERHGADSMVPQAVIYSKRHWPHFRDALAWNDAHFSRLENPPLVDSIRPGDRVTIVDRFGQKRTGRAVMRSSHGGWVLNMGGKHGTPGIADESNIVRVQGTRAENPPESERRRVFGGKYELEQTAPFVGKHTGVVEQYVAHGKRGAAYGGLVYEGGRYQWVNLQRKLGTVPFDLAQVSPRELWREAGEASGERISRKTVVEEFWIESSTASELEQDPSSPYRMVTSGGQRFALSVNDAIRAQKQGLEYRGRPDSAPGTAPLENPPPDEFGRTDRVRRPNPGFARLEAFRVSTLAAIAKLATTEAELQTLFVQAMEMIDRGAPVPEWIRSRARGLQLEKTAQLEAVKRAVERHGAALGEFSIPKAPRRKNPAGGRAAAVELYRQFHGTAPQSFHTQKIPDLSQLVHLGSALRVDYQAARPRGPRGTPYRHEFARGSELFTDRTGRALVILGNLKVSRAPRGRFGYIRAGAGA